MTEIWKPVVGYENNYEVSSYGNVRRKETLKILKPNKCGTYYSITLCISSIRKDFSIHTLVCTAFNGPKPSSKHEVNHKDGIKSNNRPINLEWVTKKQQQQHRFKVLKQAGPMTGKKHADTTKNKLAVAAFGRNRNWLGQFN